MKGAVQSRQRLQNQTLQRRDLGHEDEAVPVCTGAPDRTRRFGGRFLFHPNIGRLSEYSSGINEGLNLNINGRLMAR